MIHFLKPTVRVDPAFSKKVSSFSLFLSVCFVYNYVGGGMRRACTLDHRGTWRPKEGTGLLQAGVTDCCKMLDVGAKNQLRPR